jgi:hypothetical protein
MPLLNPEQTGWLKKINRAPMRRDGNDDPLPYSMATLFLHYQLIELATGTSSGGIATQTWRCWKITDLGKQALRIPRRHLFAKSPVNVSEVP